MSNAKGPRGASGTFGALAAECLCLGEEAFTLALDSSSGDVEVVRLWLRRLSRTDLSRRSFRWPLWERLPSGLNIVCTGTGM